MILSDSRTTTVTDQTVKQISPSKSSRVLHRLYLSAMVLLLAGGITCVSCNVVTTIHDEHLYSSLPKNYLVAFDKIQLSDGSDLVTTMSKEDWIAINAAESEWARRGEIMQKESAEEHAILTKPFISDSEMTRAEQIARDRTISNFYAANSFWGDSDYREKGWRLVALSFLSLGPAAALWLMRKWILWLIR